MTIEDAPEKIWIAKITASVCGDAPTQELDSLLGEPYVEYTRSDIAKADWYMRAEVARLEQVAASLEVYIMQMEDKIDSLEKSND